MGTFHVPDSPWNDENQGRHRSEREEEEESPEDELFRLLGDLRRATSPFVSALVEYRSKQDELMEWCEEQGNQEDAHALARKLQALMEQLRHQVQALPEEGNLLALFDCESFPQVETTPVKVGKQKAFLAQCDAWLRVCQEKPQQHPEGDQMWG